MTESPFEPTDPERFASDLAAAVNRLMGDPAMARKFGVAGRRRAEERFSWDAIAKQTKALYGKLLSRA